MIITPCHEYIVERVQEQVENASNLQCLMANVAYMVARASQAGSMADSVPENILKRLLHSDVILESFYIRQTR